MKSHYVIIKVITSWLVGGWQDYVIDVEGNEGTEIRGKAKEWF